MAEDDVDAEKHELELLLGQSPDAIGECLTVESDNLRDVGDRVLRQAGEPGAEQDVARCFGPAQVAGQGDTDDGRDVAAVEDVPLDDHDLSLIHISEPTRLGMISYAVFCLKKKKQKQRKKKSQEQTNK